MLIDHPMLSFDLGRHILTDLACGQQGYSFADFDLQAFLDEEYRIVMKYGLPKPASPGPLTDVCDQIHSALCKLRDLPPNLVNGVPEWN